MEVTGDRDVDGDRLAPRRGARWRRLRAGGGAMLVAAAIATGCRESAAPRIGIVLGGEGLLGAKLAIDSLHASADANLGRLSIRTLIGRYNSDATIALAAAESLATDPTVIAIVGHSNSGASIAASQVYNAHNVVQIAPTTTSPIYSLAGPWSFRLVASDEHQASFLAEQLVASNSTRIAIVHVNDDYGRALRRLLVAELAKRGVHPVYDGSYVERDSGGIDETAASIVRARPTSLAWLGRESQYLRVGPSLRRSMPGLAVLASDGFGGPSVERDSLHRYSGVRYVRLIDVARGSPPLQALRTRYRQAGGGELTDQAALSYDAVMLLGQAMHEVGADREAIRVWLTQLGRSRPAYQGVTGPITFSPQGERLAGYTLATAGTPSATSPR